MGTKQDLIAIKNLSELMLDLAYSAVFLHDAVIAAQVAMLHTQFKKRLSKILQGVPKKDKPYIEKMGIYLKEIATNAVFLAHLSESTKVPRSVQEALTSTDKRIIEELVHFSSFFIGQTPKTLQISHHTKARLVAVKRNEQWIFDLNDKFKFRAKDLIIAVGTTRSAKLLREAVNTSIILKK